MGAARAHRMVPSLLAVTSAVLRPREEVMAVRCARSTARRGRSTVALAGGGASPVASHPSVSLLGLRLSSSSPLACAVHSRLYCSNTAMPLRVARDRGRGRGTGMEVSPGSGRQRGTADGDGAPAQGCTLTPKP